MAAAIVERIGPCEICGLTDHHLVDGICPTCRPKCATMNVCGNRSFVVVAREKFIQLGAAARLALANLDMPDDENAGDEAGVPREAAR